MKMLLLLATTAWFSTGVAMNLPMPPNFSSESESAKVLQSYPLGVITELAARSHHGHPDHKISLPNGLEGWVYEVHSASVARTYTKPSGNERVVQETDWDSPQRAYTLVFGIAGKVIDVLYDGMHPTERSSALQDQRQLNPEAQKLPGVSHGLHFPPGSGQDRY